MNSVRLSTKWLKEATTPKSRKRRNPFDTEDSPDQKRLASSSSQVETSIAASKQANVPARSSESSATVGTDELFRQLAELRQQYESDKAQFQMSLDAQNEKFEGLQESLKTGKRRNGSAILVISIKDEDEDEDNLSAVSTKNEESEDGQVENQYGADYDSLYDATPQPNLSAQPPWNTSYAPLIGDDSRNDETPQSRASAQPRRLPSSDASPENDSRRNKDSQPRAPSQPPRSPSPDLALEDDDFYAEYPEETSDFEEDPGISPLEETKVTLYQGARMPTIIEELEPLNNLELHQTPNEVFKLGFLKKVLGGSFIANCCYGPSLKSDKNDRLFPGLQAFKALKRDHQPLLPRRPGQHGAQISCIFSAGGIRQLDEFALFIQHGTKGYKYIGHYREPRASDLLGGNEMCQLPIHIKKYWAQLLGEQKPEGKSAKAIDTLTGLWSRVPIGWLDEDTNTMISYYPHRIKDFVKDAATRCITAEEAERITVSEVLASFERADYEEGDCMRLFYEYCECVRYDSEFYEQLLSKKQG